MAPAGIPLIDTATKVVHRSSGLAHLTSCGHQVADTDAGDLRALLWPDLVVCEACWGQQQGFWPPPVGNALTGGG